MWMLPSKNRVGNLRRFFQACRNTEVSTPGLVLLDDADYKGDQRRYDELELPSEWKLRITKGVTQGDKVREIWNEIIGCEWVGRLGDDNVPTTPGWDRHLVNSLDGWNMVSCNDGWQAPRRLGDCWVFSGELLRSVGYIFAPGMHHLFVDDLWETIGREAGCWVCRMDVLVQHLHVLKGDAPPDATHRAIYGDGFNNKKCGPDRRNGMWSGDERVYHTWLAGDRHRVVAEVRKRRLALALTHNHSSVTSASSISRNAVCPCGSGKRYKHCHGRLI